MNIGIEIIIVLACYLVGSISFARIITKRWAPGKDVTQFEIPVEGTDDRYKVISVGANSVSGELGPMAGMTVSLLDILKIILPALFCRLYFHGQPVYMLSAALAGVDRAYLAGVLSLSWRFRLLGHPGRFAGHRSIGGTGRSDSRVSAGYGGPAQYDRCFHFMALAAHPLVVVAQRG